MATGELYYLQVCAWKGSNNNFGIRIGKKNRDRFFKKEWLSINVEIDGADYTFKLTKGFWKSCPEFRDPAIVTQDSSIKSYIIKEWLKSNFEIPWKYRHPPKFKLIQKHSDESSFKLVC